MKCVRRNTKIYYYANYEGKTEITDQDGNYTGEVEPKYSDVKTVRGVMSAFSGNAQVEMFGTFKDYDCVLVTDDTTCEMDENSILWVDNNPSVNAGTAIPSVKELLKDSSEARTGIVKRVSKTPNVILIAIKYVGKN